MAGLKFKEAIFLNDIVHIPWWLTWQFISQPLPPFRRRHRTRRKQPRCAPRPRDQTPPPRATKPNRSNCYRFYEQRIDRSMEKHMAKLNQLRQERNAECAAKLKEQRALNQLTKLQGLTFGPAANGFDFSASEVKVLHRRSAPPAISKTKRHGVPETGGSLVFTDCATKGRPKNS
jgi:hypothetical protein